MLNCIAVLLPLNLLALSFARERGIVTQPGARRLGWILAQIAVVVVVIQPRSAWAASLLGYDFVEHRYSSWSNLPQISLVVFVASLAVLLMRTGQRRRPVDIGLMWALVAVFIALNVSSFTHAFNMYVATAGLILGVAVLETSYAMAYIDELTGLPGRRAFNEALLKLPNQFAIAMVDIDHFKKFNDKFGHDAGDQVLNKVASKLAAVDSGGTAFRYGGEEFALLFPGRSADEILPAAERVREAVAETPFVLRAGERRRQRRRAGGRRGRSEVMVTVSIGVAAAADAETPPEHVLKAADRALYRAKAEGRNCTVISER
jgi:diguanylate cyclase (GGDEF)-like protein